MVMLGWFQIIGMCVLCKMKPQLCFFFKKTFLVKQEKYGSMNFIKKKKVK